MYPVENGEKFYDINIKKLDVSSFSSLDTIDKHNEMLGYINFIQTRLSTNIMLLNKLDIANELGYNQKELLLETKKLAQIAKMIEIPDVVEERKR